MFEIYRITNLTNGKMYVGQTSVGAFRRFQQHTKADTPLGRAIRKYGADNFKIEILSTTKEQDDANKLEEFFIKENQCVVPDGYNLNEYGRLVGFMDAGYIVWFRKDKIDILNNVKTVILGYILKIVRLIRMDLFLKKNRQTKITSWRELWGEIECNNNATKREIKNVLIENNMIEKTGDGFIANPEVFAVYY